VALCVDIFKTPVTYASYLRDFLGEVLGLALMSPNVSYVSTVCFILGFLSIDDTFSSLSLLTQQCKLCLPETGSHENLH
jgi:hypothetical protein